MQSEASVSDASVTDNASGRQDVQSPVRVETARFDESVVDGEFEELDEVHSFSSIEAFSSPQNLEQPAELDVVWLDETLNNSAVDIVLPLSAGQSLSKDDMWVSGDAEFDETSTDPLVLDETNFMDQSMEFMAEIQDEDFDDTAGFNVPSASYTSTKKRRGWVKRALSAFKKIVKSGVRKSVRSIKRLGRRG